MIPIAAFSPASRSSSRTARIGATALVIEPATAPEVAPIITRAYGLSTREELISQGYGMHLSGHTVRDHVKAVFEKVGVSSRGALVAKLFAEHYAPLHLDPDEHHQIERQPGQSVRWLGSRQ